MCIFCASLIIGYFTKHLHNPLHISHALQLIFAQSDYFIGNLLHLL